MYYTIKEFSRKLGVSETTLRNWDRTGKLIPHHRTTGGHRMYSDEQIADYFGRNTTKEVRFVISAGKPCLTEGLAYLTNQELETVASLIKEKQDDRARLADLSGNRL